MLYRVHPEKAFSITLYGSLRGSGLLGRDLVTHCDHDLHGSLIVCFWKDWSNSTVRNWPGKMESPKEEIRTRLTGLVVQKQANSHTMTSNVTACAILHLDLFGSVVVLYIAGDELLQGIPSDLVGRSTRSMHFSSPAEGASPPGRSVVDDSCRDERTRDIPQS